MSFQDALTEAGTDGPGRKTSVRHHVGHASALRATFEAPEIYASSDTEWRDLVARSLARNVFAGPAFVGAAARGKIAICVVREGDRLMGVAVFSRTPLNRRLPLLCLSGAINEHAYLPHPVLAAERADEAFAAILDAVAARPDLPKRIWWPEAPTEGPVAEVAARVLTARDARAVTVETRARPYLAPPADPDAHFRRALSAGQRHNLRRCAKRLAERGAVTFTTHRDPDDARGALGEFLALEASGWKGGAGTALGSTPGGVALANAFVLALAQAGKLRIEALRLDGRAVAMWIFCRSGDMLAGWKIAYDETLAKLGPGMLLLERCTRGFLADPTLARVDSCSYDRNGFISKMWPDHMATADLLFDARRGGSVVTTVLGEGVRAGRAALRRYRAWRAEKPGGA
jgi:CelD/BcsL family acetyltransferase involved in cellulose biosynthesis